MNYQLLDEELTEINLYNPQFIIAIPYSPECDIPKIWRLPQKKSNQNRRRASDK